MLKRTLQATVAIILISPLVFGGSKTFTWIPPTLRAPDASGVQVPLLDAEIKEYYLICNSGFEVVISNKGHTDSWTSAVGDFPPGFYDCWMRTVDVNDLNSDDSNVIMFSVRFEVIPTEGSGSGCT